MSGRISSVGKLAPKLRRNADPYIPRTDAHVKQLFGEEGLENKSSAARTRAAKFFAKKHKLQPKDVRIDEDGRLFVTRSGATKMRRLDIEDQSFLIGNDTASTVYEFAEMAYNDVMSGTASALGDSTKKIAKSVGKLVPESVKTAAKSLLENGGLVGLTATGAAGALGVGVWLTQLGIRETAQGFARSDRDQMLSGARHTFLGAEATAASAALASQLSSHAFFQAAGGVAKAVAAPFAVIHGAVDVVQGTHGLLKGVKQKDALRAGEGLAEIGMGIGWLAAGFGAAPAVVGFSCLCLAAKLGVGVARRRKEKKILKARAEEALKEAGTLRLEPEEGPKSHTIKEANPSEDLIALAERLKSNLGVAADLQHLDGDTFYFFSDDGMSEYKSA